MPPLMRLPGYEVPRNALIDFSPINSAIDSYRQQQNQDRSFGLQQEGMDLQKKQFGLTQERDGRERENEIKRRMGNAALLLLQEKDPARQAAMHQQMLALHPDAKSLPDTYKDPRTAALGILGDAGMAGDYLSFQMRQQEAARAAEADSRAKAEAPYRLELLKAQTAQANQRDDKGKAEAQILQGIMPYITGAGVPPGGGGRVGDPNIRQQSFGGEGTGVPGIVQVADPTPAPAPAAPVQPASPMDRLTPGQRIGLGLALIGKGDAGKIIAGADPNDPNALGKEARNEVDKKMLASGESLARLNQIAADFRPEFMQIEDRLGYGWTALASKFRAGQAVVTPEQQKSLAEFAAFRATSIGNLNQYIKDITGAAMTNAEADRIMKAMPNPGAGIMDGDDPVSFKAKLDVAIRDAKHSIARYNFLRTQGFKGTVEQAAAAMPLSAVPAAMNQRGKALLDQLQQSNPGIDRKALAPLVNQQLRQEFGMNI